MKNKSLWLRIQHEGLNEGACRITSMETHITYMKNHGYGVPTYFHVDKHKYHV